MQLPGRTRKHCDQNNLKGGGAGHQYWSTFTNDNSILAPKLADDIHSILFKPSHDENAISVIRSQPLAGKVTNGMQVVYELMKLIKDVEDNNQVGKSHNKVSDDDRKMVNDSRNGTTTINRLTTARKLVRTMLFEEPGSLGLFPSIYFYNSVGKFIEGAFLGMAQLILERHRNNNPKTFINFTTARSRLEIFLLNHKVFLTQINRKFGSNQKSYRHFKGFFENLFLFINEMPISTYNEEDLLKKVKAKYEYLNEKELDYKKPKSDKFSPEQKKAMRYKEEIIARPKCKICLGILHPQSMSDDHIDKQEEGGWGKSDEKNRQNTHFYCNNSRDKLEQIGFYTHPS